MIPTVRPRPCRGRMLASLLLVVFASSAAAQPSAAAADLQPAPGKEHTQTVTSRKSQPTTNDVDVCSLLSSAEIAAVQGEPLREAKRSEQVSQSLRLLQCYYATPSLVKSISVAVAVPSSGSHPREYWQSRFHNSRQSTPGSSLPITAEKRDAKAPSKPGHIPPVKISGIGEEAFWMGSRFAGALYVLSGNKFLRLSVGGGSEQEKLEKSKQLAQHALRRLQAAQHASQSQE